LGQLFDPNLRGFKVIVEWHGGAMLA
jgi:hypothetical protein